jgi:ketosteroid isomerase-like protein
MRRVLFVFALTMALVRFVGGQVPAENASKGEVEKEVLAVEEERDRALQEHNVAVLDRIYADDLVFVNTRGQVFTKAQRLASIGSGAVEYFSYKQSDYSFHVYGTTVVMTGRTSSIVKFQGRVNRTPRQFTNVYVKLNGQWRLVAHQATPIAEQ